MCCHLDDANGAASSAVLSFVKKTNTKFILVLGQAGTGKSTILEELTGLDLSTREYQICPAIINGGQYLFVDTTGFGSADINDFDNFKDIMACIYSLGLIITPTAVMLMECFCGPEFFKNIIIVTSMWDKHFEDDFEEERKKVDELVGVPDIAQILKPPSQYYGGIMYHHGLPGGKLEGIQYTSIMSKKRQREQRRNALRDLICDRYANCKPVKLQVMKDANNLASWKDTEAAKVLMAHQFAIEIKISNGRAIVCEKKCALVCIPPKVKAKEPQQDEAGWLEAIYRWYEVIKSVSA